MVIVAAVCSYVYPLLANPFLALVVTAFNLLPVLLLLINAGMFGQAVIFWLLGGCALTAVIDAKMLGPFFARLAPAEQPPEQD